MTWQDALAHTIEAFNEKPITWGLHDCCQFVQLYATTALGHSVANGSFAYSSEFGAERLIVEYGGLVALFEAVFGEQSEYLEPGGIVLVDIGEDVEHLCAGVWIGPYIWAMHPHEQLARVSSSLPIKGKWPCPKE